MTMYIMFVSDCNEKINYLRKSAIIICLKHFQPNLKYCFIITVVTFIIYHFLFMGIFLFMGN